MPEIICGNPECSKPVSQCRNFTQCCFCNQHFHIKCSIPNKEYEVLVKKNIGFYCQPCIEFIFHFCDLEFDYNSNPLNRNISIDSFVQKKCKCGSYRKNIKINMPAALCSNCSNYFHLKCEKLTQNDSPFH